MHARQRSLQKRDQEFIGAFELGVVGDPYGAHVGWQVAPAAGKELAAHHGGDPVRFEKSLDEMRFGRVPGDVDLLHREFASSSPLSAITVQQFRFTLTADG